MEACSGLNDTSYDTDPANVINDSDGVDTVGCPVTHSSSLDSPSANQMPQIMCVMLLMSVIVSLFCQ